QACQKLGEADCQRVTLGIHGVELVASAAGKLEISARGLGFKVGKADEAQLGPKSKAVTTRYPTQVVRIVAHSSQVIIVTRPATDGLNLEKAAKLEEAGGHVGQKGEACESQLTL